MKHLLRIILPVFLSIVSIAIIPSCNPDLPVVTTTSISEIEQTSALSGGNVTDDGGADVTARGVCWDKSQNPTTGSSKTSDGTGAGVYTSTITGLTGNTTYYLRAYATNSEGTGYGNEVSFSTNPIVTATLTTVSVTMVTSSSAVTGGNITSNGGGEITAKGVCWGIDPDPTTADSKTTDGSGTSNYVSLITGLNPNTQYQVRAYATNSAGTAYGNSLNLTTQEVNTVTDIDGNIYNYLNIGYQKWMTENLKTTKYNDGNPIDYSGDDNTAWQNETSGAYAWYNNDEATYKNLYGALYNFYAVNTGKLCPVGWHVPSNEEWTTLISFLGGVKVAGDKLKEAGTSHWKSPNEGATNESGFTALPGGHRHGNGTFNWLGEGCYFFTPDENLSGAIFWGVEYDISDAVTYTEGKNVGFSVRCVKD